MSGTAAVLVIADDLTGANATAAGFAREGLRAVTVGAHQDVSVVAEFAARFDAVIVSTDGRHCRPDEAAERARAVVRAGWPATLVCNRIDSTLRGNLGASTAAILEEVAAESGQRTVALCAPAHPDAGRQTVEGSQLLDGARLEDTELSTDARSPIRHSNIAAVLQEQATLRVAHLPLEVVTADDQVLRAAVQDRIAEPIDVLVADALTTDHLERVANAAVTADTGEVRWISVDPGPGSVALARAMKISGGTDGGPILAVSGSVTRLTRTQLARLRAVRRVTVVRPVAEADSAVPDVDRTAADLAGALAGATADDVVLLATALDEDDVVTLRADEASRLPPAMARTVRRALEEHPVDGLFVTGGDVSAALFAELAAHGLDVEEEVAPLAVAGTFLGGPWAGLSVVTKGGMVGDEDTTVACVDHVRRAANATRRHVRAAQSRLPL